MTLHQIACLLPWFAASLPLAAEPVGYWDDVRPILQASCQGCHQPAKAKGDYILTDVARLIAGGEGGGAVVPHKPDGSFLLEQITPEDGEAEMPPKDDPLSEGEIALIRRWIAEGAKDDTPENARQRYDMDHPPEYAVPPVVTSLDYSPDGALLAVAGFHEVLLHRADGSGLVARLVGLSERIESVAFSPDGKLLAATGGLPGRMGEVQVWDVAKRSLKVSVPVTFDTVYGASWSPDSELVAFGCSDNTLRVVKASSGRQVLFMGGHNDWVLDTVFSAKGDHLVSVGRDMTTKLTKVETERLIDNITSITPGALKGGIATVDLNGHKDEILVGGSDGVPQVFRLTRQTARKIGDNANLIRKFEAMKGRIWDAAYSPDGKRIAAVSSLDGRGMVRIYSAEFDSAIPGDVKKIFGKAANRENPADLKRLEEFWTSDVQTLATVEVPESPVYSVAYHPDGSRLAVAGGDGIIRFLDAETGEIVQRLTPIEATGSPRFADRGRANRQPVNQARGKRAEASSVAPQPADITSLTVLPKTIAFGSRTDYAQVLVLATLRSGSTADVTRLVKWEPARGHVRVDARGLAQPVSDGRGTLRASLGKHLAEAEVTVRGSGTFVVPDYVRDVKPVLSRLGCDAGTCHGAKDGKNGFKLSLRGYDPLFDVRALTDDLVARRVNHASPDDSLMLLKATGAVPHEGQQVTEPGSDYYQVIREWIANGARLADPTPVVQSIEVFPKDPVIRDIGGQQQVRVVATYKDGTKRDVTREAFVESGNIEVARHDDFGLLTTLRRGEAPVLVRYEGAYAVTTITVMGDRSGFAWEEPPAFNEIDRLAARKWQRMKILPSGLCSDGEFLRRVHLDLTGLPPDPDELLSFLADGRPSREKREAVVDALIGSPAFIEYWTNKWADLLMVNSKFLGNEGAAAYRGWIRDHVEKNTPYDEFVHATLTASGSNKDNPAASYYKIHRTPDALMENTTHLFLATRFNCNKCHDHPFERWTQDQYYEVAAFFAQVDRQPDAKNSGNKRIGGTAVELATSLYEIVADKPDGEVKHERTGETTAPAYPYVVKIEAPKPEATRREQLAAWLTAADNRFFAASYANRIWGYLLGTGIIEPLDDIRAGNPPSNPELLAWLTREFVAHDFDVRHLMRTICNSRTYQLSIATNEWNADDTINFAHAKARRLPAEVLFDSVYAVTGATPTIPGAKPGTRAAELPDARMDLKSGFLANLGRPVRESSCECERSSDVQLGAVMALLSGPAIANAIGDGKNAIARLTAETPDDRELIEQIFLRVLNRRPTSRQVEVTLASWGALEADHQKVLAALEQREAAWAPVAAEREGQRQQRIAQAQAARDTYLPAYERERKRLEDERARAIAEAEKAVTDSRAELPAKAAEFEANLTAGQRSTQWHLLAPAEATASDKSKVEVLPDGSVRGGGKERSLDYLVAGDTTLTNITGIMIESVPDPSFRGPGAGLNPDGNFVLTELQARWKLSTEGAEDIALSFTDARTDFTQKGFDVKLAIDGKVDAKNKGWALSGSNLQVPHRAQFKLTEPMPGDAKGARLSVGVLGRYAKRYPIGRFRLWVTTDENPLEVGLPAIVAEAVGAPAAERSDGQQQAILTHLSENDPELQKHRFALAVGRKPVSPDGELARLGQALEQAGRPVDIDPRVLRARRDAEMSARQLENRRLTSAQDLTWALINTSDFLFNR